MNVLDQVLADLDAEGARLEAAVAGLDEAGWRTPTPAEGWDIATQISHLAWTDVASVAAVEAGRGDKTRWDEIVLMAIADPEGFVDTVALEGAAVPPAQLLAQWSEGRTALAAALRSVPEGEKLPWFGPPMSPASMATARFMETWAHALDVYDALGLEPEVTDRIKHVVHLGVRTRNFAFSVHGLDKPAEEFRVELVAPSGETWTWGPEDADQRVTGTAWDFARLATQRIHRDDTELKAVGEDADRWLDIVQAFAGPAGQGREKQ